MRLRISSETLISALEVRRCNPQTQDIRTQIVDYLLGRHHIAQGFGHLSTIGIYRKTVRQDGPAWGTPLDGNGRLQ